MKITSVTSIPDILIIEPTIVSDTRGFFFESFNISHFVKATGITVNFVQENYSYSLHNVLRGLHYQIQHPQGKLIRVIVGEVFDVVVDIRQNSTTFGSWIGNILSAKNKRQLWIPAGFAHGFLVRSSYAEFLYKTTDYRMIEYERCILWNDPAIGINWNIKSMPLLSIQDTNGKLLIDTETFV